MRSLLPSNDGVVGRTPLHSGLDPWFVVAGGGFEPPTFGLSDLTHLSMREEFLDLLKRYAHRENPARWQL